MTGQKRSKMGCDGDGADPRTAAAMRDTESLVQIQVAHIGANIPGPANANLGIHVGAIHINLTTEGVYKAANLLDRFLKNTVGGWVGHHERRKGILVLFGLSPQIFQRIYERPL